MDCLVKKQILVEIGGGYDIAAKPRALLQYPPDAHMILWDLLNKATTNGELPPLLRRLIRARETRGTEPVTARQRRISIESKESLERFRWSAEDHIREFGPEALLEGRVIVDFLTGTKTRSVRSSLEPPSETTTALPADDSSTSALTEAVHSNSKSKSSEQPSTESVPALKVNQMPAKILVALLENGGAMVKQDLHRKHSGPNAKDNPRLANLLTPRSELSRRGFIESKGKTVSLTEGGRREAELQRSRGTKPFRQRDSRSTHD